MTRKLKQRHKWLKTKIAVMILIFLFSVNAIYVTVNTDTTRKEYYKLYPTLGPYDLQPGDLLFARSNFKSGYIPGYWSHSALFWGYDENGTPMVIEAMSYKPVRLISLYDYVDKRRHVMIGRIESISAEDKQKVVNWAYTKIGSPFDYWYPDKQLDGNSFYCSEIMWAAYLNVTGVDLDANPTGVWRYANGVAPQEIFDNSLLTVYNLR